MNVTFSEEEKYLLELLKAALNGKQPLLLQNEQIVLQKVLIDAKKHAVLSVLYDVLQQVSLTEEQNVLLDNTCRQIVVQNYRLLFLTKYLVEQLAANQIKAVVLKGVSTASWYPVPELRKSGDVDLLLPKWENMQKVSAILKATGFMEKKEQHANYHLEFISQEGITVEVHTDFTEQFANKQINNSMEKQVKECFAFIVSESVMGIELPMLSKEYHAYELLLHMLHHFTTSGFGLKLLCDWVVCWKQEWTKEEKDAFQQLVKDSKIMSFTEGVTEVCVKYLGLKKEHFAWEYSEEDIPTEELLREILEAEEFGGSDNNRMVMLNGTGPVAYIKEFHHQMKLNFPKTGKCFLLWPVLWIATLVRFLRNNRTVRNTSAGAVLKEAKRRSELMKQLKLFR